MFYKCPKCQKVWQYSADICPECFLALKRMKSEKIKVIGVSKVTIPTMFHPKVPYFVLVLEDENSNKWIQKSAKEYKIGEELNRESVSLADAPTRRNAVAVWRLKYDILEGIEKVVELIGGMKINQSSKILILPTLISPKHPYFAENTSPQFLESLIKYLTSRGEKLENIKVAGQSFNETPIEASVQKSQLLKVCQDYKIILLDLAKTSFVKKTQDNFTFEISEEAFNSDFIINLPILKIGKISAMENILKFLKKDYNPPTALQSQPTFPKKDMIESLNKVLPQYLTIAEALSVQKPDQFVAHLGLIFSSFNSLNLDRVFAEVSMVEKLPECLKKVKIDDIPIIGRKIEEVQYETGKY